MVVLDLTAVDLRIEEHEPPGDAVLFFFEQVQQHSSGMMRNAEPDVVSLGLPHRQQGG
ncbi:MAG: hypothetical protein AAB357_05115 [Actinomycetota bacterium]